MGTQTPVPLYCCCHYGHALAHANAVTAARWLSATAMLTQTRHPRVLVLDYSRTPAAANDGDEGARRVESCALQNRTGPCPCSPHGINAPAVG